MTEFLFFPVLFWAIIITVVHIYYSLKWRDYLKGAEKKKKTEKQDAIKSAVKAGLDLAKVTIVKDGKVLHMGDEVHERTRNRVNAPPPGVMRN